MAIKLVSKDKQELLKSKMSKAGIEVKVSKTDIADYMATKAKEKLQEMYKTVREQIPKAQKFTIDDIDPKYHNLIKEAQALSKVKKLEIHLRNSYSYFLDNPTLKVNIGKNGCYPEFDFDVAINEKSENIKKFVKLCESYRTIEQRLNSLNTTNYKVLLTEKALNSSVSGKELLVELNQMIDDMIKLEE